MPFLKLRSGDIHFFSFTMIRLKKAAKSTSAHEGNSTIHRVSVDWKDCLRFLGRPRVGISSVNGHISVCRGQTLCVMNNEMAHTHEHLPRGMNNEGTHMDIYEHFFVLFPRRSMNCFRHRVADTGSRTPSTTDVKVSNINTDTNMPVLIWTLWRSKSVFASSIFVWTRFGWENTHTDTRTRARTEIPRGGNVMTMLSCTCVCVQSGSYCRSAVLWNWH